jgi:hypothetical protein
MVSAQAKATGAGTAMAEMAGAAIAAAMGAINPQPSVKLHDGYAR